MENPLKSELSLPHSFKSVCMCEWRQLTACSSSLPSGLRQDPGGVALPGYGEKGGSSR